MPHLAISSDPEDLDQDAAPRGETSPLRNPPDCPAPARSLEPALLPPAASQRGRLAQGRRLSLRSGSLTSTPQAMPPATELVPDPETERQGQIQMLSVRGLLLAPGALDSPVETVMPLRGKFSLRGELMHAFVSYRVSTEGTVLALHHEETFCPLSSRESARHW